MVLQAASRCISKLSFNILFRKSLTHQAMWLKAGSLRADYYLALLMFRCHARTRFTAAR